MLYSFLISIGFIDGKNIFVFLFGFVSALSISMVKVSFMILLPASVLVFAFGFAVGFLAMLHSVLMM